MSSYLIGKLGGNTDVDVWNKPKQYDTRSNLSNLHNSQNSSFQNISHSISLSSSARSRKETQEEIQKKKELIAQELEEDQRLWKLYKKRHSRLNCCVRLYLYIRHAFVIEVMFWKSHEHMHETSDLVKRGETFIMNTVDKKVLKGCIEEIKWLDQQK